MKITRIAANGPTIIYEGKLGFVTDFGQESTLSNPQTGKAVMTVPRYGVWTFDRSKGKPQVSFTTNDLTVAKDVADGKDDEVSRRRFILVHMDDGDTIRTEINGTKAEIEDYYRGQSFEKADEKSKHTVTRVEFVS